MAATVLQSSIHSVSPNKSGIAMSRNGQSRASEDAINTPSGTFYLNQASSQLPSFNSDPSINPPNLPILGTFYPYKSPEEGFGVAMFDPTISQVSPPAPSAVQYAPPPPGVQYAPAFPGTPKMAISGATQSDPIYNASRLPLVSQMPRSSISRANTAAMATVATRSKRMQSPENEGENPFKKIKTTYSDEAASRRLRIGNLDARIAKDELRAVFRNYSTESVDIFHDEGGVFALVLLSNAAEVRDAIYKLWNEKIGGRILTIALDSISGFSQGSPKPARKLRSRIPKVSEQPGYKLASLVSALHVPPHLFHWPQPAVNTFKPSDRDVRPELKAIAENRRIYINNLPFGTTENILRDLLKEYSIENLTVPYNPRTRLSTGYFAFVDFIDPKDVPEALEAVSRYNLAGNEIKGSANPAPAMLSRPEPCAHLAGLGEKGRLKITGLAPGTAEEHVRKWFDGLSTNRVIVQKYLDSERSTGDAFVDFNEVIDSHHAAIRLSGPEAAILGNKIAWNVLVKHSGFTKNEPERSGKDPQLLGAIEYGIVGNNPRLRPESVDPPIPKKQGDAIQLDPVPHRPAPSIQTSALRWPSDFMQLDPVPHQPAPSEQPSLRKKQRVTPKVAPQQRRTATVVQTPLLKVQGGASGEDQEANIFNRTALRDWFWEHKGLSLDI